MFNDKVVRKKEKNDFFFNGRQCLCYNKQLVNGKEKRDYSVDIFMISFFLNLIDYIVFYGVMVI